MKGPTYDTFILRQQLALHSRLCENEDLKDSNADVNTCVQRQYAYTLTERQTIAKYISQIKRSQEKREKLKHADIIKKTFQGSFVNSTKITSTQNTEVANSVTVVHPSNVHPSNAILPVNKPVGNSLISSNISTPTIKASISNVLITGVSMPVPVTAGNSAHGPTLISPTSNDSFSGTELCPDEQQPAIDFCLSFKREGSARTERVTLFPGGSSKKQDVIIRKDVDQSDDSPSISEVPSVSTPITDIETTNDSPVILPKDDFPMLDYIEKEHIDLKGSPKYNGDSTDSSQDSEDNLVINLDDNIDTEDNDNDDNILDVSNIKKLESCGNSYKENVVRNDHAQEENNSSKINVNFESKSKNDNFTDEINVVHSSPRKLTLKKRRFDQPPQNILSPLSAPSQSSATQTSFLQAAVTSQSQPTVLQRPTSLLHLPSLSSLNSNLFHPESSQSSHYSSKSSSQSSSQLSSQSSSSKSSSSQTSSQTSTSQTTSSITPSDNYTLVDMEDGASSGNRCGYNIQDNYDNVTMDEGSEDSQETTSIRDNIEMEDIEFVDKDEDKTSKCSSPSLSQLNNTKEKILLQLSILTAQTEEKNKTSKLLPVRNTSICTPKYDSYSDSGSESQDSEVIPFLGDDNESEEDTPTGTSFFI